MANKLDLSLIVVVCWLLTHRLVLKCYKLVLGLP